MSSVYKAPVQDINFVLQEQAGMATLAQLPGYEEATPDMVAAILEGAASLAEGVIAPLNWSGDQEGSKVVDRQVVPASGFKDAYWQYVDGGWNSLPFDPEFGGQGLPTALATAVQEMVHTGSLSFGLCPMLTQGAINAVLMHGTRDLQDKYLEKLITGEWTGTMNLTEPQAGSDLAAVRATAEPDGAAYRIRGTKIFITWGDHDMTDNVIHLVLARLPDAPPGVKGISLFLVPKYLLNDDGTPGARNDVYPASVEHKLGIHASPTCVMSFGEGDGAIGYLVGEENNGLACMFTMMNHARLSVGLQGVAVSERALQHAVSYAKDRVQGTAPGTRDPAPIIKHPDVRRMLMQMKAMTEAGRALAYVAMASADHVENNPDAEAKAFHEERVALLTPIVKGWCTEFANEVTSLGVQVHGGMGFIEETGAAQHMRDARILAIYEGTNGIQAMDLVGRKFLRDGGSGMNKLLAEMRSVAAQPEPKGAEGVNASLAAGCDLLEQACQWISNNTDGAGLNAGTAAYNFLMLAGTVTGGWQMAVAAQAAARQLAAGEGNTDFLSAKLITARFFADQLMPRAKAHLDMITAGSESTMALAEEHFGF